MSCLTAITQLLMSWFISQTKKQTALLKPLYGRPHANSERDPEPPTEHKSYKYLPVKIWLFQLVVDGE